MEQPSYYAILSANVRYDKNISDKAKLLFADITALSNKNGYCTASNNYFAELFDVKKETISRNISSLEKNGHVKVELVYRGKEVIQRRIYPITQTSIPIDKKINTPIDENTEPLLTKNSIGIDENMLTPIDENVKENITSINNTRSNNTSSNSKSNLNDNDSFKEVLDSYQKNIQQDPPPLIYQKLIDDFEYFGKEIMLFAIEKTALKNEHEYRFINYLLSVWRKQGLKTIEAVKQFELIGAGKAKKNIESKEMTPKWINQTEKSIEKDSENEVTLEMYLNLKKELYDLLGNEWNDEAIEKFTKDYKREHKKGA